MNIDVNCEPYALRQLSSALSDARGRIADALEEMRAEFIRLHWDDNLAVTTEKILDRHITAMNGELTRLGRMIRTLEDMLEAADRYTSHRSAEVDI